MVATPALLVAAVGCAIQNMWLLAEVLFKNAWKVGAGGTAPSY
ncbi:MAG: hypothetical protein Q7J02_09385 [Rhodocyclaceae bacterium]|nr:hypothetical protein [Rhodocyclaceae bacterium]